MKVKLKESFNLLLMKIYPLPEINKLYYKYKSNNETILLHPEISSPIAAVHTKLM
jgi:hypothetical protein